MPATDHNAVAYTIHSLVYLRLTFINNNPTNDGVISSYIVETAYEAQPCFKVPEESIAHEDAYTPFQKSILADMVAVAILKRIVAENSQYVSSNGGAAASTYLKRAKAGSAEAEFEQVDITKSINKEALLMSAGQLIDSYTEDIMRKYGVLGCVYNPGTIDPGLGFIVVNNG